MFEVGDNVISANFGNGVITSIDSNKDYPIKVKFKKYANEETFSRYGLYRKSNEETHPDNIKKPDTTPEAINYKKTKVTGFGFLLEFDNGICIYHPNQGQPFQVYPKSTSEGLS